MPKRSSPRLTLLSNSRSPSRISKTGLTTKKSQKSSKRCSKQPKKDFQSFHQDSIEHLAKLLTKLNSTKPREKGKKKSFATRKKELESKETNM